MDRYSVRTRNRVIEARVTDEEGAALEAVANYHRRKRSEMLRFLIRREAESLNLWDDIVRKSQSAR